MDPSIVRHFEVREQGEILEKIVSGGHLLEIQHQRMAGSLCVAERKTLTSQFGIPDLEDRIAVQVNNFHFVCSFPAERSQCFWRTNTGGMIFLFRSKKQ